MQLALSLCLSVFRRLASGGAGNSSFSFPLLYMGY